MTIFEFFSFIPKPAIFIMPLVILFLGFAFFSLFKRKQEQAVKEEMPSTTSPLTSAQAAPSPPIKTPSPAKPFFQNLLLILSIVLLVFSLPLAFTLIRKKKATPELQAPKEQLSQAEISPSPTLSLLPEESEATSASFSEPRMSALTEELPATFKPAPPCQRIKIYDEQWQSILYANLSHLSLEQVIRIAVIGQEQEEYDKARIRINSMAWLPENETTKRKPDSPQEFYLECEAGMADGRTTLCGIAADDNDQFKIEAEIYNSATGQWY